MNWFDRYPLCLYHRLLDTSRMFLLKLLTLALPVVLYAGSANATNVCNLYSYLADYNGACERAVVFGRDKLKDCENWASYSLYHGYSVKSVNRAIFQFHVNGYGNLYLQGTKKTKPDRKTGPLAHRSYRQVGHA